MEDVDASAGAKLRELLSTVLGSASSAGDLISTALSHARRAELPDDPTKLLSFARAHVIEQLAALVGPRLALTVLEELRARLRDVDAAPASTRQAVSAPRAAAGMLLVDPDAFLRAGLARLLVRETWRVEAVARITDAECSLDAYDVVVVSLRGDLEVKAFARRPGLSALQALVVLTYTPSSELRQTLSGSAVPHELLSSAAPGQVVVARVRELLARVHGKVARAAP